MKTRGPRTYFVITALLAALCPLLAGTAAAAPSTMIVLSSAAYAVPSVNMKAGGVAADAGENIFVTGYTDGINDFHTVQYSKLLVQQGAAHVFGNPRSGNIVKGIVVDKLGNIIVVGFIANVYLQQDFFVLKYSPTFIQIASATYEVPFSQYNGANGVGVDSQNNIFITGYTDNGSNRDFYTIKFDLNLNMLSSARYDSGGHDEASALAIDADNNVIVAGFAGPVTNHSFFVRKYDNDLNRIYDASFGSGGDFRAKGVAADSDGNVIVTGLLNDGVTSPNYLTVKYDSFLNFISSAVYDSGAANTELPAGVAVDSNGNSIVTGFSTAGGTYDYFTIKYDRNLAVLSTATYNKGGIDQATGVIVDDSDNVLVTGYSQDSGYFDYFTVKYNASPKITKVSPLYIGETSFVTLEGNGLLSGSSVSFSAAGISTGTISFSPGPPSQISVSVTISPSVMLGPTPITVLNVNGDSVTNSLLALTQLRSAIGAGAAATLAAQTEAGPVSVTVPAGTFLVGETVTLFTMSPVIGDLRQVGQAIQLNVSPANVPLQNITVKLPYKVSDLGTYPETGLNLAYFDTVAGWVTLPSSVNTTDKTVSAAAKKAGTKYAVVKAGEGVGIPIPTPGSLGGGKVYPNPYRPGSGGYFDQSAMGDGIVFAEMGAGQSVKLTIVDVAGRLVFTKSGSADADGKFFWNAKTASGGVAASGVYLYSITGSKPRQGKFSIIR